MKLKEKIFKNDNSYMSLEDFEYFIENTSIKSSKIIKSPESVFEEMNEF